MESLGESLLLLYSSLVSLDKKLRTRRKKLGEATEEDIMDIVTLVLRIFCRAGAFEWFIRTAKFAARDKHRHNDEVFNIGAKLDGFDQMSKLVTDARESVRMSRSDTRTKEALEIIFCKSVFNILVCPPCLEVLACESCRSLLAKQIESNKPLL